MERAAVCDCGTPLDFSLTFFAGVLDTVTGLKRTAKVRIKSYTHGLMILVLSLALPTKIISPMLSRGSISPIGSVKLFTIFFTAL